MVQIAFDEIGSNWVDASTLGTLTSESSYFIQNRGAGVLLAVESASEPQTEAGTVVNPLKVFKYTAGEEKLWLKSIMGSCLINISEA